MSKPHEEDWEHDPAEPEGWLWLKNADGSATKIAEFEGPDADDDNPRARLAAQAPKMARKMLEIWNVVQNGKDWKEIGIGTCQTVNHLAEFETILRDAGVI